MKIIKAKTAGFCFGVRRAVDTVYEQLAENSGQKIYTYGPIIHNEEVIKDMEKRGVIVLRSEEELEAVTEGIVIIRSHGVEKRIYEKLNSRQITVVDATCPFVKKIHTIVERESEKGKHIIIIGDPEHPEVKGIRGWQVKIQQLYRVFRIWKNFLSKKRKRSVSSLRRHLITTNLKI